MDDPITVIISILSLSTALLTWIANRKKASASLVTNLTADVVAQNDEIIKLKEVDIRHQRELNDKEARIKQLVFKNRGLEERLGEYWKILQNRNPDLEKTLDTIVSSQIEILKRLEGAEVIKE